MATQVRSGYPIKTDPTDSCAFLPMSPSSWIVGQFQAPLHMGAAELPVRCRLHRGIESITEMCRPEIY